MCSVLVAVCWGRSVAQTAGSWGLVHCWYLSTHKQQWPIRHFTPHLKDTSRWYLHVFETSIPLENRVSTPLISDLAAAEELFSDFISGSKSSKYTRIYRINFEKFQFLLRLRFMIHRKCLLASHLGLHYSSFQDVRKGISNLENWLSNLYYQLDIIEYSLQPIHQFQ